MNNMLSSRRKIYLDYASTTPLDPEVQKAMAPYFAKDFGNPGSVHGFGQKALGAVDWARETIAKMLGAEFEEIIFTGSATEANNLVLRGVAENFQHDEGMKRMPRVIVSSIEHESVLKTARNLKKKDVDVIYLPVSPEGAVDLGRLKQELDGDTILVSVMYANNEIGAVEPIAEIGKIIKEFRKSNSSKLFPLFHTDAAQAFQFLDCDANNLGVDFMTISGHKIYGPKGAAALYARKNKAKTMRPIIEGGGQEFGFRSGTENVPAIVGLSKAMELASSRRRLEGARLKKLRDYFAQKLSVMIPDLKINTPTRESLPNNLNVSFPEKFSDILIKLDLNGVAASSGSACSARIPKPSHVLVAIGLDPKHINNSIRFSLGRKTSKNDIDIVLERLKHILYENE